MDYEFLCAFDLVNYIPIPPPINHADIAIECIFSSQFPSASIQSIVLEWVGDNAKKIYDYIQGGITGTSNGIYEGIPLKIVACDLSLGFDIILNISDPSAQFECDNVKCPLKMAGTVDWMNDIAGSISFGYFASGDPTFSINAADKGKISAITFADYKMTPYCLSTIPDYTGALLSALTVYELTAAIIKATKTAVKLALELANATLYLLAAVGELIRVILEFIFEAVIIILEVIELIKAIENVFNYLIQPKKYKLCMRAETLFQKFSAYLGLTFSSTIFSKGSKYYDMTWMPKKIVMPSLNFNPVTNLFDRPADELTDNGFVYGYPDGTCADWLREMLSLFNAEIVIRQGVLHFEEKHFWFYQNPFIIPNTRDISDAGSQFNIPDPHGTNASECPPSYLIGFQLDQTDQNTFEQYTGTTSQILTLPAKVQNQAHVLTPPGQNITFGTSLGFRKNSLTAVESFLDNTVLPALIIGADALNGIINTLLAPIDIVEHLLDNETIKDIQSKHDINTSKWVNKFSQRIGWLLLYADSFNIPKVFIGEDYDGDWHVSNANSDAQGYGPMTAKYLMINFHEKNLALHGNQYWTYTNKKFKFCCADFQQVLNNNIFQTPTGELGKFTKLIYHLETETAENVDYRIQKNFTNNLTEQVWIDGIQQ